MFFMFVVNVMFVDINSILCRSLTVSMISSLETMVELLQQSQCIVVLTKFGKAPRVAVKKNCLTFNLHKPTVTSLRLLTQLLLSDWFLLRDTCAELVTTLQGLVILGLVGAGKTLNGREEIRENFFPPEFFLARLDFSPTPLTAPGSPSMRPSRIPLCFSRWVTEYLILPF